MSNIDFDISINDRFIREENEEIENERSSNIIEDNDHSFNQLLRLQLLIQKHNGLKELCK